MNLDSLIAEYGSLTQWTDGKIGEMRAVRRRFDESKGELEKASALATLHGDECDILRATGEFLRKRIKHRVENLVTLALRSVFGRDEYRFELDMELKRGQMTATPMLVSEFQGNEIKEEIIDGHGGGVANVVAFVLQAIVLSLTRPKIARVMLLDEAFSNVRDEIGQVATLLQKFHEITGINFVVVTKEQALCDGADIVYDVSRGSDGVTRFKMRGKDSLISEELPV